MKKKYLLTLVVIIGLIFTFYSFNLKQKKEVSEYIIRNENSIFQDKLARYNENEVIEEKIEHFPSGKIMRYTSYDNQGKQAFTISFDEKGNVENFKGYPLIETYQNEIATKRRLKETVNQYLKVGDTLKHHYLIANIPYAKRSVKIENTDVDNTKIKRILKKTSQIGVDVKEILIQKGINTIETVVNYEFNDKEKTSITYTESFEVIVN